MSFSNNVKKKILDKSDMFNFYKDGYETYKANYEKLIQNQTKNDDENLFMNKRLNSQIKDLITYQNELENEIITLKKSLSVRNDNFVSLENELRNSDAVNKIEIENIIFDFIQEQKNFNEVLTSKLEDTYDSKVDLDKVNKLENKLNSQDAEIHKLTSLIDSKNNEVQNLNEQISLKNSEIRKLRIPFDDFSQYLIEAYSFPLVRPPFTDEEKRIFSFMEEVAKYLISKVDKLEKKPLISVIMPVYNRKDVVMNAIDSVLAQTYENFELIVIDDASTDGTTELLKKINHDKVKVIFHEKNKYASGARNTGLKNANGEYIAYLDSDNLLDERYLSATVGAFLELPDAGGIYSAQYRYETYDSKPFAIQFGSFNKSLLHNHNFVDMNCFAHRRDVYERLGGFDETLKGADDWELILKISNNYKIYSVPFLLSKCYLGVVDNRVSDLIPTDMDKIRVQNEVLPTTKDVLNKKVSIIIPIFDTIYNLKESVESILALNLNNVEIIVASCVPNINLNEYLKDLNVNDKLIIVQSDENQGFTYILNKGISVADSYSDILILHQEAILTEGSLEILQKSAYNLKDCGLVVSQQVLKNGSAIKNHVPYAHDDYWCDITPSKFYKNIFKVPIFHNGEFLELRMAPFFCTYIKRAILNNFSGFDENLSNHYHSMCILSEFVRNIMKLKIFHVSDAIVIRNASEEFRNKQPIREYDFNFNKEANTGYVWDF